MNESIGAVSLKCASCGAALQVTPDLDLFACRYCGVQQQVHHSGGTVALKLLEAVVQDVQKNTERAASELTVRRLREDVSKIEDELGELEKKRNAAVTFTGMHGFYAVLLAILGMLTFWWVLMEEGILPALLVVCVFLGLLAYYGNQLSARKQAYFKAVERTLMARRYETTAELDRHLASLNGQSA